MKTRFLAKLVLASTILICQSPILIAKSATLVKLKDFVRNQEVQSVKISPDGKYLSVVYRTGGEEVLAVLDAKTRSPVEAFRVKGDRKSVGDVFWANNERLIYSVTQSFQWDRTLNDTGELIGVNVDGGQHKTIFGHNAGDKQVGSFISRQQNAYGFYEIIDLLPSDKKNILIAFFPSKLEGNFWVINREAPAIVYRLNIYNGKRQKVTSLPIPLATPIADSKKQVRFVNGTDVHDNPVLFYRDIDGDEWKHFSLEDFDGYIIRLLSFHNNDQNVYVLASTSGGTESLYSIDLEKKSVAKIFQDEKVDVSLMIEDFEKQKIVAVGTDLFEPKYHYLEEKDRKAKIHKALKEAFSDYEILITSATESGDTIIVKVYSDFSPASFYIFDTKTFKAEFLLSSRKWLDPFNMAETEGLSIKTRDGEPIYGYLTRPKGLNLNLPLVVIPHGGPHGIRDWWGFDWEVQLLANRGYAVLQVNYRGSGGFGEDFQSSGYGEWGALMQDDITDATHYLIDQKIADENRICIFGHSYGGYAALMGAVREPKLYQCAIGSMGVYDLPMMFEEGDIYKSVHGLAYLKRVLGEDLANQRSRSPAYNADKITADVLLIHGRKDKRAPIKQAESMKQSLKKANKDTEWLELNYEGHGYFDEDDRLRVYSKILQFLEKNIGKGREE